MFVKIDFFFCRAEEKTRSVLHRLCRIDFNRARAAGRSFSRRNIERDAGRRTRLEKNSASTAAGPAETGFCSISVFEIKFDSPTSVFGSVRVSFRLPDLRASDDT